VRQNKYQEWKSHDEVNNKIELIKKIAGSGASEAVIASKLGICKRSFITLKGKHKDIDEAYQTGKEEFKGKLIEAIIKRALGFKTVDEDQYIEETSRGTRKRIIKHIKEVPPDINAAKYLLLVHFGREFSDKKIELDLMEKRIDLGKDEWPDANNLQEDK